MKEKLGLEDEVALEIQAHETPMAYNFIKLINEVVTDIRKVYRSEKKRLQARYKN